jgi:hypothetical protein
VQDALAKAGNDIKAREVEIKERKADAEIAKLVAEAVQTGVASAFASMQAGQMIAMNPAIAPVADSVMQIAGYQRPTPQGQDPNFMQPVMPAAQMPADALPVNLEQNTSPQFPALPDAPGQGMQGMETARMTDNAA